MPELAMKPEQHHLVQIEEHTTAYSLTDEFIVTCAREVLQYSYSSETLLSKMTLNWGLERTEEPGKQWIRQNHNFVWLDQWRLDMQSLEAFQELATTNPEAKMGITSMDVSKLWKERSFGSNCGKQSHSGSSFLSSRVHHSCQSNL